MKFQNKSWIEVSADSDFPIENIPFGIILPDGYKPQVATRIGNTAVSLSVLSDYGYFDDLNIDDMSVFCEPVLNGFMALGKKQTEAVRKRLMELFNHNNSQLRNDRGVVDNALFAISEVEMLLPVKVTDYTDFYSSIEHATNVGKMFRNPENALLPNWKHLPVGYHGRSSSIVVSGTGILRPNGQLKPNDTGRPVFGPTKQMDFELEMAFITGKQTLLGESIATENADEYIFGMVIFNDLSARDIQKWEYVPLGPFLSKSFGSVISPWIVTLEALAPFRVEGPKQNPPVLPYLQTKGPENIDINLEVLLQPLHKNPDTICRSNFKYMYWNMRQQLAHQTVNGCNINVGDMYASGTISGTEPGSYGSMLELSWRGEKPLKLSDGSNRTFINDDDTIIMRAHCQKEGLRVGFGESVTKILPAKKN